MADPAFDAASTSSEVQNTSPISWTHNPAVGGGAGTPAAAVVYAIGHQDATDEVTGCTYGGVAMARPSIGTGFAADTAIELGWVVAYVLGSGLPAGSQTVSLAFDTTAPNAIKKAVCITYTADGDMEVVDVVYLQEDMANPSFSLASGSRVAVRSAALFSGRPSGSISLGAGNTAILSEGMDADVRSRHVVRANAAASGTVAIPFTASSDDVSGIGIAMAQVVASSGIILPGAIIGAGFHP